VLTGGYILSEWRPELINSLLDCLTPQNVRVAVVAQRYQDKYVYLYSTILSPSP
jgi:hypothetical protein